MKKYRVNFVTKDGDYDKEWCYADSEEEAAATIKREHCNIDRITSVVEI